VPEVVDGQIRLEAALAELPSAKTPCPFAMYRQLAKLFLIFDNVLALNGLRRAQSLRFSHHCRRQRVESSRSAGASRLPERM
jgi:hypothetical protein